MLKDYVLFPLLSGPFFLATAAGNAVANVVRNVWAFTIIFCGHFPDGVAQFSEEEADGESRGGWYLRQILGSANIRGGRLFHILSGNLSFQIEHHLYPDLPAHRYKEVAPEVQAICQRYGIPYNTGGLTKQFATVVRRIFSLGRKPAGPSARRGAWQAPRLRVSASANPNPGPKPPAVVTLAQVLPAMTASRRAHPAAPALPTHAP
jgi:NADPH-dependent stearoyl-CoA 9-desaturase